MPPSHGLSPATFVIFPSGMDKNMNKDESTNIDKNRKRNRTHSSDSDQHAVEIPPNATSSAKRPVKKKSRPNFDQKAEARNSYVGEVKEKRSNDKVWKWLYDLGIPCHNLKIPIWPHTMPAALSNGDGEDVSGGKASKQNTYAPHNITPEVLSLYCDWKTRGELTGRIEVNKAQTTNNLYFMKYCRQDSRRFIYGQSPARPDFSYPPIINASRNPIECDVVRTLRRARNIFRTPRFNIPIEWKEIEIEGLRYLPEAYKVLLRGSKSKGSDENLQDLERELSQPPESPSGSPEPPSYRPDEKEQLEYFSRNFPIDDSVDDPVENAKRAKAAVEEYNFPRQLDQARNSVALKFQEDAFKYLGNLITKEKVEERDRVFGAGSVLFNDEPSDMCAGHQTAAIILTWMHKRRVPVDLDTEAAAEKEVGGLLNKIIIGEVIEVGNGSQLKMPTSMCVAASNPHPDVFSRAKVDILHQLKLFSPVLFAGECKQPETLTHKTPAQLACALNGTLALLVMMYLDKRESQDELLPPWLFVYGILYTSRGVIIRAHYPSYRFKTEGENDESDEEDKDAILEPPATHTKQWKSINSGEGRWIFKSVEITDTFRDAFVDDDDAERLKLLAVLLMIRGHTLYLLDQFETWNAGDPEWSALTAFNNVLEASCTETNESTVV